jgi:hypothetical protein
MPARLICPFHRLDPAVVAVAAPHDAGLRPMTAQAPDAHPQGQRGAHRHQAGDQVRQYGVTRCQQPEAGLHLNARGRGSFSEGQIVAD